MRTTHAAHRAFDRQPLSSHQADSDTVRALRDDIKELRAEVDASKKLGCDAT
jgi:hypothetical protein